MCRCKRDGWITFREDSSIIQRLVSPAGIGEMYQSVRQEAYICLLPCSERERSSRQRHRSRYPPFPFKYPFPLSSPLAIRQGNDALSSSMRFLCLPCKIFRLYRVHAVLGIDALLKTAGRNEIPSGVGISSASICLWDTALLGHE